jgi:hypothetical protein
MASYHHFTNFLGGVQKINSTICMVCGGDGNEMFFKKYTDKLDKKNEMLLIKCEMLNAKIIFKGKINDLCG